MRLINAEELMKCYENTPDCNIDDCSVPIPVVRQNIIDMPTVSPYEWISVEDGLPEDGVPVLVYKYKYSEVYGNMETAYINNGHWRGSIGEAITHWMPLPTPPTEKEN